MSFSQVFNACADGEVSHPRGAAVYCNYDMEPDLGRNSLDGRSASIHI